MLVKLLGNPWILLGLVLALGGSHLAAYRLGGTHAENAAASVREARLAADLILAGTALADESDRAAEAERSRDRLSRRLQEIDREPPPPPRPDCNFTDAEHRLLERRRLAIIDAHRATGADALPDPLPRTAPNPTRPERGRQGSTGLGLRLSPTPDGVPALGHRPR